jgi:DNA polymerase-3 subunit epsilon
VIRLPWFRSAPQNALVAAYAEATPRRVAKNTPVAELRFVVLDAETTGFDTTHDRILSLAAVPVRNGTLRLAELQSWMVYHDRAKMTDAVRVHGIMPADVRAGQPEPQVLEELLPVLTGAVLVGHHVGFDVAMLNAAMQRHFGARLRNPTLDTAALAMRVLEAFRKTGYVGQRAPSLEEVCTLLDLNPVERHTAAGDTFTTADLFMLLCAKQARQRKRPLLAGDLPIENT